MLCTIQSGRTTSSHCCSRCTTSSPRRLSMTCTSRPRGPDFLIPNLARYALFTDMRWVCRHDACETLSATLPAVIDVLEDQIEVSGERGATARSVMAQLNTSFVVHLCILKFLPKICADASAKLQGKSETLEKALQAIKQYTHGWRGLKFHWRTKYGRISTSRRRILYRQRIFLSTMFADYAQFMVVLLG